MSLSKWLQHDNGPQNRLHMSPLLQSDEEEREDSTMTITSTHSGHVLRRASLTEDMFRDPDAPVPEGQRPDGELQRLVIERNLSSDQFEAPNLRSATNGEAEGTQMTINAPALLDRPVPARANPMARFHEQTSTPSSSVLTPNSSLMRHPDRGAGFYHKKRERFGRASLVETGRHAGRSRVAYYGLGGHALGYHAWKRDFFTSGLNLKLPVAICGMVAIYILSYFFWGLVWLLVYWHDKTCVAGFEKRYHGVVSAFMFATETQQTIGYGGRRPRDCWLSAWLVALEVIYGQLLDAVTLGIIFARIAHPKNRARTVFISDCAVVARRDGALKFMFRVADVRQTQVVSPRVRAFLYTWGGGRVTAEGEHIPFRMDPIELQHADHISLVLPLTLEHEIDERSPLYGHTYDSLSALDAEIVVLFEGVTETGALFSGKRSYLPTEIHWGYTFCEITHQSTTARRFHAVDLSKFHEVEPQKNLHMMAPPQIISQQLLKKNHTLIPYPALSEKTLVLAEHAVVGTTDTPDGQLSLMIRIGDVYPDNMVQVSVRLYLYRWNEHSDDDPGNAHYQVHQLEATPSQLCLRLPMVVRHTITPESALASWRSGPSGIGADASSEVAVVVDAIKYDRSKVVMAKRIYPVHSHVKYGYRYAPLVSRQHGKAPRVAWTAFHNIQLAPPNLPRVRSSRTLISDRSLSQGMDGPAQAGLKEHASRRGSLPAPPASSRLGEPRKSSPRRAPGPFASVFKVDD